MTGAKRKKMLSLDEIDAAVAEVAAMVKREGVHAALVGGVALALYGSDRFTADIDFVADDALSSLPEEKSLSFGGYQSHTPGGVAVDWILRSDDFAELYEEALLKARRLRGVPVAVVSPEYLAAMKLVAGRAKGEADLEMMLEEEMVDVAVAAKLIKRLLGAYAAKDFLLRADLAKWTKSRK